MVAFKVHKLATQAKVDQIQEVWIFEAYNNIFQLNIIVDEAELV